MKNKECVDSLNALRTTNTSLKITTTIKYERHDTISTQCLFTEEKEQRDREAEEKEEAMTTTKAVDRTARRPKPKDTTSTQCSASALILC